MPTNDPSWNREVPLANWAVPYFVATLARPDLMPIGLFEDLPFRGVTVVSQFENPSPRPGYRAPSGIGAASSLQVLRRRWAHYPQTGRCRSICITGIGPQEWLSPSLNLEDTSSPWSAYAPRPEC